MSLFAQLKSWWMRRFHRCEFSYRACTLHPGDWHSGEFAVRACSAGIDNDHQRRSGCNDAWVCACGLDMATGVVEPALPVATLLRKPTHS